MTVLYHENFDGLSDGIPPGWSTILGVGMYSGAASVWTRTAVSGTRVIGRGGDGDSAVYSPAGALTDQAIRTAQKWVSHSAPAVIESLLRNVTTSAYEGYRLLITSNGSSSITGKIYLYQGTHTLLATAAAAVTIAIGDVLHTEFKVVGTSLEGRLWINSDARPSSATVSVTNAVIASGYAGLRPGYSNGWSVADDVVITDGAGGEDYFYPESSAATATTLSGPSSGTTGVASTNFTVGANGTITGTVTVTPGDAANGGTFTPTSVAISSGTPTATFTYTPASTGVKTISISDDGGLTDATSISYTSNAGGGSVRTPAFYQTFIAGR